ncbi:hypothetical protein [Spiroplasma alleghenense]|uniref:Uncharacterized protein n=1 Tax=Spiroplasma alleghenense TaxID=216931 RepID=A0A345Z4R9_9MOLU|nr:hypothetical protein [Spiroplasma alleghenense]AXK51598.1 hypothetical protein SALLE_v1c09280 [Spiroplasma alleghenense]
MKIKSNKKTYLWLGVFGSLALVASSSAILANSLSHNNNPQIQLKNNYDFTSKQQVISSFQKADIEEELIALYLNELEKVSTNSFYKSMVQNSDFVDVNLQIQNEISSRLVTRNYSEGQVREQIGFVKNILFQNILAYENLVSSDDYDQIMKIEFFKYNFDEWSNLNNVEKYKYIYDYRETLVSVLQNLIKTKEIKQELMKREFEANLDTIKENEERITVIDEQTRDADNSIKELAVEIENVDYLDNSLINEITENNDKFVDVTARYALAMTQGSITIGVTAWSFFWPPATLAAIAAGKIFELDVKLFKNSIVYSKSELEKSIDFISNVFKKIKYSVPIIKIFIKNLNLSNNLSEFFGKTIIIVDRLIKAFNILITAATMGFITDNYIKSKKEFNETSKKIEKQSLDTSKGEIDSITSKIRLFDNEIFNLLFEKNNLNFENKIAKIKNSDLKVFNQEIELNFSDMDKKFSAGNLIQENDIFFKNQNNEKSYYNSIELTEKYISSRKEVNQSIDVLKNKLDKFNSEYTYSDKIYWQTIFEDIYIKNINILNNLFY